MSSYQYRKSHCGDRTILRPSYPHNEISYTGKIASLYWIRAQFGQLGMEPIKKTFDDVGCGIAYRRSIMAAIKRVWNAWACVCVPTLKNIAFEQAIHKHKTTLSTQTAYVSNWPKNSWTLLGVEHLFSHSIIFQYSRTIWNGVHEPNGFSSEFNVPVMRFWVWYHGRIKCFLCTALIICEHLLVS